ncbi:MAG: hypothetical protein ACLT2T_01510 [Bilophila wadsworthia]
MDGLQWTQERKLAGCDQVIANSGTEGALRDKAGLLSGRWSIGMRKAAPHSLGSGSIW